jgi:hypothetical protein
MMDNKMIFPGMKNLSREQGSSAGAFSVRIIRVKIIFESIAPE